MKKILYLSSALIVLGNMSIVNAAGNNLHGGALDCGDTARECCRGFYRCLGMSHDASTDESGIQTQSMPDKRGIQTIWDISNIKSYREGNDLAITLDNLESLHILSEGNKDVFESFTGGLVLSNVSLQSGWGFSTKESDTFHRILQSLKNVRSFRLQSKRNNGSEWSDKRRTSSRNAIKILGEEIYKTIQYFEQLEELNVSSCELTNADFEEILKKYNKQRNCLEGLKLIELKYNDDLLCSKNEDIYEFKFEDPELNIVLKKAQERGLKIKIIGSTKASSPDLQDVNNPIVDFAYTESQLMAPAVASVSHSPWLASEMKESNDLDAAALFECCTSF